MVIQMKIAKIGRAIEMDIRVFEIVGSSAEDMVTRERGKKTQRHRAYLQSEWKWTSKGNNIRIN